MYPTRTQQCVVSRCCSGASCVKRDLYIHNCVSKETYIYIQRAHNNVSYKEKLFETTQNSNKLYGFDVFFLCTSQDKNVSYLKKLFGLGKLHLKIVLEREHLRGRSLQRRHLLLQRRLRGGHLRLFNTHCIYVYLYAFVYTYLFTYYIYVYLYTYTHMYVYVNTYICMNVYINIYAYVCMYIYIYVYTHIYMYMYKYILIYQHIYIHTVNPANAQKRYISTCQHTKGMYPHTLATY